LLEINYPIKINRNEVNGVFVIARHEAIPNKSIVSEIASFAALTDTFWSKNVNARIMSKLLIIKSEL